MTFTEAHNQFHPEDKEAYYIPKEEDIVLYKNNSWLCAKKWHEVYWLIAFTEKTDIRNIKDLLSLIYELYTIYNVKRIVIESKQNLWTRLISRFTHNYYNIDNRDFFIIDIPENINTLKRCLF